MDNLTSLKNLSTVKREKYDKMNIDNHRSIISIGSGETSYMNFSHLFRYKNVNT